MYWARILAFVTGMVDQELLARNEYPAAENRILKAQAKGWVIRPPLARCSSRPALRSAWTARTPGRTTCSWNASGARSTCGPMTACRMPATRLVGMSISTIPHHNTHLAMWLKRTGFVGRDAIPRGILGSVVPVRRSIGRLMSRAQRGRRSMVRPGEDGLPRSLRLPRPAAASWAQSAEASRRCSG
jgi:hypothetical protein